MGERDKLSKTRLEAIMDLVGKTEGKATADEIELVAKRAHKSLVEKTGDDSEDKFMSYAFQLPTVVNLRNPTPEEDVFLGIDKWITFDESLNLPELPVQVKSSYRAVKFYKGGDPETGIKPDPGFVKLNGIQIVVNCGRRVSMFEFKNQIEDEIQRITNVLYKNPTLLQALERINQR